MGLDKNSFNVFDKGDLNDIYDAANAYYMSAALDRHLSNSQQVARAYVEAVLSLGFSRGVITFAKKEGKDEVAK